MMATWPLPLNVVPLGGENVGAARGRAAVPASPAAEAQPAPMGWHTGVVCPPPPPPPETQQTSVAASHEDVPHAMALPDVLPDPLPDEPGEIEASDVVKLPPPSTAEPPAPAPPVGSHTGSERALAPQIPLDM